MHSLGASLEIITGGVSRSGLAPFLGLLGMQGKSQRFCLLTCGLVVKLGYDIASRRWCVDKGTELVFLPLTVKSIFEVSESLISADMMTGQQGCPLFQVYLRHMLLSSRNWNFQMRGKAHTKGKKQGTLTSSKP